MHWVNCFMCLFSFLFISFFSMWNTCYSMWCYVFIFFCFHFISIMQKRNKYTLTGSILSLIWGGVETQTFFILTSLFLPFSERCVVIIKKEETLVICDTHVYLILMLINKLNHKHHQEKKYMWNKSKSEKVYGYLWKINKS